MPLTRVFMLIGLSLPLAALAYGMGGGDGRVELGLLALGVVIFFIASSIEKKRTP